MTNPMNDATADHYDAMAAALRATPCNCDNCLEAEVASQIDAEIASEDALARKTRSCPGWGEDCGNLMTTPDADLCGDCHSARLDYQSPRIGNPRR